MKKLLLFLGFALSLLMNAQVPSYVPTNGLVAYYPFNGNANDASINALNGTNGGATLTTDRFGNPISAYSFIGGTYINILDNSLFNTSQGTWSAWYCFTAPSGGNGYGLIGKGSNFTSNLGILENQNNISSKISWVSNQASSLPPSRTMNGNWHNYVLTWDNSTGIIKGYSDGVLLGQATYNTSFNLNNGKNIRIGRSDESYWQSYNGKADDFGIWNRVLTQSEITNLYNANICYQNITVTDTLIINTGILSYNTVTYNNTVTIYPNPANDQITINCGNIANVVGYQIKITNSLGQVMFNQPMNTQQYVVPINTWTGQGMYFVSIINAQGQTINTKKIILQ
jgi:hypothetical protein